MRRDVLQMCTSYYYIFQQSELYFSDTVYD